MLYKKQLLFVILIFVFLYGIVQAASGRLATNITTNGGCEGAFFNVTALNENLFIHSFKATIVGTANTRVYYKRYQYQGFENNASAWTLLGSQTVVGGTGTVSTLYPINVGTVRIPQGETYGFMIYTGRIGTTTLATRYATATTVQVSNEDIVIQAGDASCGGDDFTPFDGSIADRAWNGAVTYSSAGSDRSRSQFTDGRINRFDFAGAFVMYPHQDEFGETGVIFYDWYNENTMLLNVSAAQIAAVPEFPETNTLIAASEDGRVSLYRLTDGQLQAMGPTSNGKTYVVIFEDIGNLATYISHEEYSR